MKAFLHLCGKILWKAKLLSLCCMYFSASTASCLQPLHFFFSSDNSFCLILLRLKALNSQGLRKSTKQKRQNWEQLCRSLLALLHPLWHIFCLFFIRGISFLPVPEQHLPDGPWLKLSPCSKLGRRSPIPRGDTYNNTLITTVLKNDSSIYLLMDHNVFLLLEMHICFIMEMQFLKQNKMLLYSYRSRNQMKA